MEKIFLDLTEEEKVSVIKEKARQVLVEDFIEYLNEKYDRARLLASNEIGVIVGQAKDEDGFASDVVVTIKVSTKAWYNKGDCARPVKKFDLDDGTDGTDGADAYEMAVKAKKAPKK